MIRNYEQEPLPEPDESGIILVATIPGPLPPVPPYLIRHRDQEETDLQPKDILAEAGIKPENSSFTYHDALRAFELGRQAAIIGIGEKDTKL